MEVENANDPHKSNSLEENNGSSDGADMDKEKLEPAKDERPIKRRRVDIIKEDGTIGECKICGDPGSGVYFGVLTCIPCKAFYIRTSAEDPSRLACSVTPPGAVGACVISRENRSSCKACRYRKCLAEGMARRERPHSEFVENGRPLCVVCHDKANGVHFGVVTCEGCKKFFRRSLKDCATYSCSKDKNCVINPETRNNCRGCRMQKCLDAGMSREAIQMGRPSRSIPSTPKRRKQTASTGGSPLTKQEHDTSSTISPENSIDFSSAPPTSFTAPQSLSEERSPPIERSPRLRNLLTDKPDSLHTSSPLACSNMAVVKPLVQHTDCQKDSVHVEITNVTDAIGSITEASSSQEATMQCSGPPVYNAVPSTAPNCSNGLMSNAPLVSNAVLSSTTTSTNSSSLLLDTPVCNVVSSTSSSLTDNLVSSVKDLLVNVLIESLKDPKTRQSLFNQITCAMEDQRVAVAQQCTSSSTIPSQTLTSSAGRSSYMEMDIARNGADSAIDLSKPAALSENSLRNMGGNDQHQSNAPKTTAIGTNHCNTVSTSFSQAHGSNMSGMPKPVAQDHFLKHQLPQGISLLKGVVERGQNDTNSSRTKCTPPNSVFPELNVICGNLEINGEDTMNAPSKVLRSYDEFVEDDAPTGGGSMSLLIEDDPYEDEEKVEGLSEYWKRCIPAGDASVLTPQSGAIIGMLVTAYEQRVAYMEEVYEHAVALMNAGDPAGCLQYQIVEFLKSAILFCNNIPGNELLSPSDKKLLLREFVDFGNVLVACNHFYCAKTHLFTKWYPLKPTPDRPDYKTYTACLDFGRFCHGINMDFVELAFMSALVTLRNDVPIPGLENPDAIEVMRAKLIDTLHTYTTGKLGSRNERMVELFSIIPNLTNIGYMFQKMWKAIAFQENPITGKQTINTDTDT